MSGLFGSLLRREDANWSSRLNDLVSGTRDRGRDGTRVSIIRGEGTDYWSPYDEKPGGYALGYLGCAYNRPISLAEPDPGPFRSPGDRCIISYDGVISGYTGSKLAELFGSKPLWSEIVKDLGGQFAMLMFDRASPQQFYYAVRAKPLHYRTIVDPRGIIVASSPSPLMRNSGAYSPRITEIPPYTAGSIATDGSLRIAESLIQFPGEGSLVLSGGGLDTMVAAFSVKQKHPSERMTLLYVDYGAKAGSREWTATLDLAYALSNRFRQSPTGTKLINMRHLSGVLSSDLTDYGLTVSHRPQAGKASEWVPARNTILMSLALAYAEVQGYARIVTGINADAATAYPDNDEEWLGRFQRLTPYALGAGRHVSLDAPLGRMNKIEIVQKGSDLKIPWDTIRDWSCYEGGRVHCGTCSSCRARRRAFELAGVDDTTGYAE